MRIVFDTNVLLAAFGHGGLCRRLLAAAIASHRIVLCQFILDEFTDNLREKFNAPEECALADRDVLQTECEFIEPAQVDPNACRDPQDLPVLGCLLAAQADCLVTGDNDLLTLGEFSGHPILSPRQLLDRLQESAPPSGP